MCARLSDSDDIATVNAASQEDLAAEDATELIAALGATVLDAGRAWDTDAVRAAAGRLLAVEVQAWRIAGWRHRHGRGAAPARGPVTAGVAGGYAQPAGGRGGNLTGIVRTLLEAQEGSRNECLMWAACRAAEAVRDGLTDANAATATLIEAAVEIGLPEGEARATIRSGFGQRDRRGGGSW